MTKADKTAIQEIANPAAVGWRWTTREEGFDPVEHEVTWIRGQARLFFSIKSPASGRWSGPAAITNPDFELVTPTLQEARKLARKFIEEPGEVQP